jgi:hypothetical protein
VARPSRREASQVLGVTALIALICWFFGVDAWHAILLACAITVIGFAGLLVSLSPQTHDLSWRSRKPGGGKGARSEVANLSGALRGRWGVVGRTAERRLWQIARRRLALEGLDLQNPADHAAIEARVGRPVYRTLMRTGKGSLRMRTLSHCLDTLDALNPTFYPEPAGRARPRRSTLILRRTRER